MKLDALIELYSRNLSFAETGKLQVWGSGKEVFVSLLTIIIKHLQELKEEVLTWQRKYEQLESEMLAACIESSSFDMLYKRIMELTEREDKEEG